MVKQFKRKMSVMLILLMVLTVLPQGLINFQKEAYAAATMKVGDYVQFGKYLGTSILWRVINVDADGSPMLWSDKILCLKAFDAAESGIAGKVGKNKYSINVDRQENGSNKWENSNLREWLNSSDNTVKYTTQPPTKEAVFDGKNSYSDEAGFLSNFSEAEINTLKPISRKTILHQTDKGEKDGGTEDYEWKANIETGLPNYSNAYYKNVSDKVYLLDINELNSYVYTNDKIRNYVKSPTKEAVMHSEFNDAKLEEGTNWFYYLRNPSDSASIIYIVRNDGDIDGDRYSYICWGGVVPALNLKPGILPSSGDGSMVNPYVVKGETDKETTINNSVNKIPIIIVPGTVGIWPKEYYDKIVNWGASKGSEIAADIDDVNLEKNPISAAGKNIKIAEKVLKYEPSILLADKVFNSGLEKVIKESNGETNISFAEKNEYLLKNKYITFTNGKYYYIDPISDAYTKLISTLESTPYEYVKNKDLFVFGYDTLETSISENGKELSDYIESVLNQTKATKVRIIAHSQGNLVARSFIQDNEGYNYIDKFIMVAPPNHGVTKTYGIYNFGSPKNVDITKLDPLKMNLQDDLLIGLRTTMELDKSDDLAKIEWVQKELDVAKDMLPVGITNFMTDPGNTFLNKLNDKNSIGYKNFKTISNKVSILYGSNLPTVSLYKDTVFGKQTDSANIGDTVVTTESAKLGDGFTEIEYKNGSHNGLIDGKNSESFKKIIDLATENNVVIKRTPVILIHGRDDNSESCWGAINWIEKGTNNVYDIGNPKDYTDVYLQSIRDDSESVIWDGSPNNIKEDDTQMYHSLLTSGYTKNVDLFVFNYPNVDFVEKNAKLLNDYIENLKIKYGYEKFDLVGHSKGGLISRFYIESMKKDENIRKLITIDTPHWGTYPAYFSFIKTGFEKLPCDVDLQSNSKLYGGDYQNMLLTFSDREKYINYVGKDSEGNEIRNQSSLLDYSRTEIKTKYYIIASINYWNGFINLREDSSNILDITNDNRSITSINNELDSWDKTYNKDYELNSTLLKDPRLHLISLFNSTENDSLGDDVVNLKSQLGIDGVKVTKADKVSIYIEPKQDNVINHSMPYHLHSKSPHKPEIINKTIEYITENVDDLSVINDDILSTNTNMQGNSNGNIMNDGNAAISGDWIYYGTYRNQHLNKVKTDGTGYKSIATDYARDINIIGDWIYYVSYSKKGRNISKIKTDGSKKTIVCEDNVENLFVVGDWMYYILDNYSVDKTTKIYKIKTDGSGRTKISNDNCWKFSISGNWIYYINTSDGDNIYKTDINGKNETLICHASCNTMDVSGDWIYFDDGDDSGKFFKIKSDGSSKSIINYSSCMDINVVGDNIYFANYVDKDWRLYKINVDGSNLSSISYYGSHNINVVGDWIYYDKYIDGNSSFWKMKIDGTEDQFICK